MCARAGHNCSHALTKAARKERPGLPAIGAAPQPLSPSRVQGHPRSFLALEGAKSRRHHGRRREEPLARGGRSRPDLPWPMPWGSVQQRSTRPPTATSAEHVMVPPKRWSLAPARAASSPRNIIVTIRGFRNKAPPRSTIQGSQPTVGFPVPHLARQRIDHVRPDSTSAQLRDRVARHDPAPASSRATITQQAQLARATPSADPRRSRPAGRRTRGVPSSAPCQTEDFLVAGRFAAYRLMPTFGAAA